MSGIKLGGNTRTELKICIKNNYIHRYPPFLRSAEPLYHFGERLKMVDNWRDLTRGSVDWAVTVDGECILLKKNRCKQKSVVGGQSLSHVWLFVTPWTAACQVPLSSAVSQSLLKFMSTELVMPSNHLILCRLLLLLPSIFAIIRVFSNESASHQVTKVLELQHQFFQWLFRAGFL